MCVHFYEQLNHWPTKIGSVTLAGKMDLSWQLGIARVVPAKTKFFGVIFWPLHLIYYNYYWLWVQIHQQLILWHDRNWLQLSSIFIIWPRGWSMIFLRRGCISKEWRNWLLFFFFFRKPVVFGKPQVISGRGGTHPLHPSPSSGAPVAVTEICHLTNIVIGFNVWCFISTPFRHLWRPLMDLIWQYYTFH